MAQSPNDLEASNDRKRWGFASVKVPPERTLLLGTILICTAISSVTGFVLTQYLGVDAITSLMVAVPQDCIVPGVASIGQHCFSDYFIPVELGLRANAWAPYQVDLPGAAGLPAYNNYPPTSMLPHLLFGVIGALLGAPMVGLLGYIIALTAAVLAPAIWAARGTRGLESIVVVFACGVAAIPAWSAVDRGNSVGFLAPLGLIFLVALCRQRWGLVAVAVVLAAMLKPQFVVMVVVFFAARKWRWGATVLAAAIVCNLAGYLLWPQDFPHTISQSLAGLSAYGGADKVFSNANVALPNAILIIPYAIAFAVRGAPVEFPASVHSLAGIAFLLIVVASLIYLGRRVPPVLAGMVLLATASLVPAVSNRYYLIFALPIAALVVRDPDGPIASGLFDGLRNLGMYRRSVGVCVSVASALTLAQIAMPGQRFTYEFPRLDGTFGTAELVVSTAHLTPVLWLVTCVVIIVAYWRTPVTATHSDGPDLPPS